MRSCNACWLPRVMQPDLVQAHLQHTCTHPLWLQQGVGSSSDVKVHYTAGTTYCRRGVDVLRALCLLPSQHSSLRCRLASSCNVPTACTCTVSTCID